MVVDAPINGFKSVHYARQQEWVLLQKKGCFFQYFVSAVNSISAPAKALDGNSLLGSI